MAKSLAIHLELDRVKANRKSEERAMCLMCSYLLYSDIGNLLANAEIGTPNGRLQRGGLRTLACRPRQNLHDMRPEK